MTMKKNEYQHWLGSLTMIDICHIFSENGATELLCKVLPRNANSKNQIYVASDLGELAKIPSGPVIPAKSTSHKQGGKHTPIFKTSIEICWILSNGMLAPAKHSKFIVYPQYPEVRFSGFLRGCREAPSFLFDINQQGHTPDRLLFLGPRPDGRVLALAVPPESTAALEFQRSNADFNTCGTFALVPLRANQAGNGLSLLLHELCRIHRLGWTPSLRLDKSGILLPCNATNCGGYTLEAQLGIKSNGIAEPDFHGWEVKARNISNIDKPGTSRVTLFTPEPDGGVYVTQGPDQFVRTWGYPDRHGRPDRLNFGGIYRCGDSLNARTNTKIVLDGFDAKTGVFITEGAIRLIDQYGIEAASWSFAKLLEHWKRKHAHAAYVPCKSRKEPHKEYYYAKTALLGEGAEFRYFLKALAEGHVFYDPGIKLENVSSIKPKHKLRSQIRVSSTYLSSLYRSTRIVEVCNC